jgi:DNA polymerase-1
MHDALCADVQGHRNEIPEEVLRADAELPRVLHNMGINTLRVPGWEADDIIASLVQDITDQGHTTLIFSSDKVGAEMFVMLMTAWIPVRVCLYLWG